MDNIIIIGSSGHAKVVIDIVEQEGRYQIAGIVDPNRPIGEMQSGYPILGRNTELKQLIPYYHIRGAIIAIGDNFIRSQVAQRLSLLYPELCFVSAIHPKSSVAGDVAIGIGTVIMSGATINPSCSIGQFCIVNSNASIDHDSTMADFSSVAPGVVTGGNCTIGTYTAINIGATLIHGIHIGEHSVIGSGSTVLTDIESYTVAYGTPAKIVRERKPGDKYL